MTVENDPAPSKPSMSSVKIGEPKFQRLPSSPGKNECSGCECNEASNKSNCKKKGDASPRVHRFMRRKMKRACCCVSFLLLVNLLIVAYIARKVSYISYILMDSPVAYMPGGTDPFCSNLCVDLCVNDDEDNSEASTFDCDISDCMNACATHFDNNDDNIDEYGYAYDNNNGNDNDNDFYGNNGYSTSSSNNNGEVSSSNNNKNGINHSGDDHDHHGHGRGHGEHRDHDEKSYEESGRSSRGGGRGHYNDMNVQPPRRSEGGKRHRPRPMAMDKDRHRRPMMH